MVGLSDWLQASDRCICLGAQLFFLLCASVVVCNFFFFFGKAVKRFCVSSFRGE
jgi:hypothetical protein